MDDNGIGQGQRGESPLRLRLLWLTVSKVFPVTQQLALSSPDRGLPSPLWPPMSPQEDMPLRNLLALCSPDQANSQAVT